MEIRHLKLIKTIAEEGGISKAIDKLYLTQSALSHQLKEAEYQLGTPIFTRENKKMVLTRAGQQLYKTATEILEKLKATEKNIKSLVNGESGEIKLSTECYTSYHWLPSLMKQFHLLHPHIDVRIMLEDTHHPLQKLLKGGLDVAITSDPVRNSRIKYIELFRDEMVAVVSENHEWVGKKYVLAEDFKSQNLIIHSLPMETVTVHRYVLAPAKIAPRRITVLPLTEASIEMVKADMGIMVTARWALQPFAQDNALSFIKIGRSGLKRKHFIAMRHRKVYPDYFNHFVEFLRKEIYL